MPTEPTQLCRECEYVSNEPGVFCPECGCCGECCDCIAEENATGVAMITARK